MRLWHRPLNRPLKQRLRGAHGAGAQTGSQTGAGAHTGAGAQAGAQERRLWQHALASLASSEAPQKAARARVNRCRRMVFSDESQFWVGLTERRDPNDSRDWAKHKPIRRIG